MPEQTAQERFKAARKAAAERTAATRPEATEPKPAPKELVTKKPAIEEKVAVIGERPAPPMPDEPTSEVQPSRKVIRFPDGRLLVVCKPIDDISPEIIELARFMEDFLRNPPPLKVKPIAMAACQFGECVRMFSCILNPRAGRDADPQIVTLVNPELIYEKKPVKVSESCLSLPEQTFYLKRGKIVKIRATLLDGTPRTFRGHDLVAQMFMHELNHLDGVLINTLGETHHVDKFYR